MNNEIRKLINDFIKAIEALLLWFKTALKDLDSGEEEPLPEQVAPKVVEIPSIRPSIGEVGTVYELDLGEYSGTQPIKVEGFLYIDGHDISSEIVDGKYTSTTDGDLIWVVKASNSIEPDYTFEAQAIILKKEEPVDPIDPEEPVDPVDPVDPEEPTNGWNVSVKDNSIEILNSPFPSSPKAHAANGGIIVGEGDYQEEPPVEPEEPEEPALGWDVSVSNNEATIKSSPFPSTPKAHAANGGIIVGEGNVQVEPPVSTNSGPSVALGLNGIADWEAAQPFINVMKCSRRWEGRSATSFGQRSFNNLRDNGFLNSDGYPVAVPSDCTHVSAIILCEIATDNTSINGRYRLTWDGDADIRVGGNVRNVTSGSNWKEFDFVANGGGIVTVDVYQIRGTGGIRNIECVKNDLREIYDRGEIFRPQWMNMIKDFRVVRFMDWAATNDSTQSDWNSRTKPSYFTWAVGVPVEVMVALSNKIGVDPWFNIPHLATDDYIRKYATYVESQLNPKLRPYFEYSNEVWNWQFQQAHHAHRMGQQLFGNNVGDAWVQYYGARSSEMAMIIRDVYKNSNKKFYTVLSAHTGWVDLNSGMLNAPNWVALGGGRKAPKEYHDFYAVTGYFDGGLNNPANVEVIKQWRRQYSETEVFNRLRDQIMSSRYIKSQDINDFDALQDIWRRNKQLADSAGLGLIMYEGGSHVVPNHAAIDADPSLFDFYVRFHYSEQMGELYREIMKRFKDSGGIFFNVFVEMTRPGRHGIWGATRYVGDNNPRWNAVVQYNRTVPGPAGRDESDFIGWLDGSTWTPPTPPQLN